MMYIKVKLICEKGKAVHIYEDETRPDITKSPVPRLFSEVVAMSIKGYHLFKITGMLLEEDVNMYIENAEKAAPGSWSRRGAGAPGSKKKVALQGMKA
jgi:hypothetical protein